MSQLAADRAITVRAGHRPVSDSMWKRQRPSAWPCPCCPASSSRHHRAAELHASLFRMLCGPDGTHLLKASGQALDVLASPLPDCACRTSGLQSGNSHSLRCLQPGARRLGHTCISLPLFYHPSLTERCAVCVCPELRSSLAAEEGCAGEGQQQPGPGHPHLKRWRSGRRWWVPGPGCLCKLLAVLVAFVLVLQATSCGYFFCVQFPGILDFRSDLYEDLQDISVLAGETPHLLFRGRGPLKQQRPACKCPPAACQAVRCERGQVCY